MSLLKRIKRVLQAQANTPTNEVEEFEPERLVADLQKQLQRCRSLWVDAVAEMARLEAEEASLLEQIERWEQRARGAVTWGDDRLAKEALREKARFEHVRSLSLRDLEIHRAGVKRIKCIEDSLNQQLTAALRWKAASPYAEEGAGLTNTLPKSDPSPPTLAQEQRDRAPDAWKECISVQESSLLRSGELSVPQEIKQKIRKAQRFREKEEAWRRDLNRLKEKLASEVK